VAVPTVSGLDLTSGPAGTLATVYGTGFDDTVSDVSFGSVSAGANFAVLDEGTLTVYIPPGSGTVALSVTNDDGTGTLPGAWTYTDDPGGGLAPTLTSIDPTVSATDDGSGMDEVTLTGSGLATAYGLYFGAAAAGFTVINDTTIIAAAPPGDGTVDVTVYTAYGDATLTAAFTYPTPAGPTLTSLCPPCGLPGAQIAASGSGLLTAREVTLTAGGVDYSCPCEVVSDTELRFTLPEGPAQGGTYSVNVVTDGGTAGPLNIVYKPPRGPNTAAAGVQPNGYSGWVSGPVTVTLTATDDALAAGDDLGPGIAKTFYRIDTAGPAEYVAPFTVGGAGSHRIEFWSVNSVGVMEAGNVGFVNLTGTSLVPTGLALVAEPGYILAT